MNISKGIIIHNLSVYLPKTDATTYERINTTPALINSNKIINIEFKKDDKIQKLLLSEKVHMYIRYR